MTIRNVSDAKEQLSALLVMVEEGEEIIIARAGKPVARLVRFEKQKGQRKLGVLKGQIQVRDDFDAPDSAIERLFVEGPIEPAS